MKTALFIIPLFVFIGCVSPSSPKAKATSSARPFMAALQAYHHKFYDYPQQLDDLRPKYLAANVSIYDHNDPKRPWILSYKRADQDNYTIYLMTTHCSQAVFKNGTFVAGDGPVFQQN
jgi:hypothetical protein